MAILEGRGLGEDHPLPSVRQWLDWKMTEVLPKAGGTLDQDPEFMRDLRMICNIEGTMQSNEQKKIKVQAKLKGG